MGGLSWVFIAIGVVVGVSITVGLILWLGLSFARKANLEDRGEWDRPLPEPLDKGTIVAVYKRRRDYHRHHRHHYRRRRSRRA